MKGLFFCNELKSEQMLSVLGARRQHSDHTLPPLRVGDILITKSTCDILFGR